MVFFIFLVIIFFLFLQWRKKSKSKKRKQDQAFEIEKRREDEELSIQHQRLEELKAKGVYLDQTDLETIESCEEFGWSFPPQFFEKLELKLALKESKIAFSRVTPKTKKATDKPKKVDVFNRTWGEILAEITDGATLVDGKQTWEHAQTKEGKNNLGTMLACCQAELEGMEATGFRPAPFYFMRAAILFRKEKLYEKEIQICEFFISLMTQWCDISEEHMGNGRGINYKGIKEGVQKEYGYRIEKARILFEKQNKKTIKPQNKTTTKKSTQSKPKVKTDISNEIISPPKEWQIPIVDGDLVLDGEWQFILDAKSQKDYEIYVYEVKDFPHLLKIGIAKDSSKRKESYYGKLLWCKTMTRRDATLVEYLFKHATYHLAHNSPPKWNVGNFQEDNALDDLKVFYSKAGTETKGITEVRKISLNAAIATIEKIKNKLSTESLQDVIQEFAISTWEEGGRSTISIQKKQSW